MIIVGAVTQRVVTQLVSAGSDSASIAECP
jgi:hypothetical protein